MYRIGIDLGGTNIAVGVVDDRHNIIAEASVPTGAFRPAEEMVADMSRAVEMALDKAGLIAADCASIGIGSPGTCDSEAGTVLRAYNLGAGVPDAPRPLRHPRSPQQRRQLRRPGGDRGRRGSGPP